MGGLPSASLLAAVFLPLGAMGTMPMGTKPWEPALQTDLTPEVLLIFHGVIQHVWCFSWYSSPVEPVEHLQPWTQVNAP